MLDNAMHHTATALPLFATAIHSLVPSMLGNDRGCWGIAYYIWQARVNGYAQAPYQSQYQMSTKLTNLVKYRVGVGTLPAYTTSLAWLLPYAQGINMLIHSYGYE